MWITYVLKDSKAAWEPGGTSGEHGCHKDLSEDERTF